MTTTGCAAFTTTVRVVDWVHDDTAVVRGLAAPTGTTGLAVVGVAVVRVGNGADGCQAGARNQTLLTRVQAQDCHAGIAADQLDVGASRTCNLTALARLHLDVVDDRTDRDVLQRHGVAGLYVDSLFRCDDLVAGSDALRSKDVGLLAVGVGDESDKGRTVRVVFQALDGAFDVELATLEVNQTIGALMTTTDEASGDATVVVTATALRETFRQRLDRLALPEARAVDDDQLTLAGVVGL